MYKCIALLFSILLASASPLNAQQHYFRHYEVEEGLSNNTVFSCVQDQHGFIWMGTKDGLNRFDGYSFKIFRNDPEDSTSIGDNFIRCLYIDPQDNLYAGTRNGIYRYNAGRENFSLVYKTTEEIKEIRKDGDGDIWFISGQTLCRLHESSGKLKTFPPPNYFPATSICIDVKGILWASTADGLLNRFDSRTNTFHAFPVFESTVPHALKWIEKIFVQNDSTILVGTSNYGVKLFNIRSQHWKDLITYNPDHTSIFARDFLKVKKDEVWIATESGIFIYDPVTDRLNNLRKEFGNPYALSDNAVYSLCLDKESGVWAGTYFGGVNYFANQDVSFEKYYPSLGKNSLSGYAVREICEDNDGNLWVGTEDAGLNRIDLITGRITHYLPDAGRQSISYSNIHGLLVRGNELWIGTFEHGLDVMDIKTGKVIRRYPTKAGELKSNFIVVIAQSKQKVVYIGTRKGLYVLDEKGQTFQPVTGIPSDLFIHAITEDSDGTIWIGTLEDGLYFFNPVNGRHGHFNYQPPGKHGLANNSVLSIFESKSGQLWIGTEGGGLSRFDRKDSSFTNYSIKQGLPSNTVFKVLEDGMGRLWVTTSNGLVSLQPRSGSITVYTTANGLLSNQFNYNSGYRDARGYMYFGSAKGLIRFEPQLFVNKVYAPPVFITRFFVNDKELRPSTGGSPLKTSILLTEEVTLKYNEGTFSIDFAALSYTSPEMTEYQYKMEGLDDDWTYLKTNRKVYFTDLSPGSYTFRVKAANGGGGWSNRETSLRIEVRPPFWASPLAYLLYGICAVILVYVLARSYHVRMRERTKRKIEHLEYEKQKEIYQAKIDFFTDVAHEIKTPLTLIKAPMEQITKKAGENPSFAYDLKIMQRNTDRLVELTNQLLDFRKIEAKGFQANFVRTNISELLNDMYSSFKILADQKGVAFTLQLPSKAVWGSVDVDALQKILNNLLYNALNYGERNVWISLLPVDSKGTFTIEIKNDGKLIPGELVEKIFEPFYRLQQHNNKAGTGIGLALSRSLAELHKGSLYVHKNEEALNIFVLILPAEHRENELT